MLCGIIFLRFGTPPVFVQTSSKIMNPEAENITHDHGDVKLPYDRLGNGQDSGNVRHRDHVTESQSGLGLETVIEHLLHIASPLNNGS